MSEGAVADQFERSLTGWHHSGRRLAELERYGPGPMGLILTDEKGDPIKRNALGHMWRRSATKAGVEGSHPTVFATTPHRRTGVMQRHYQGFCS